MREGKEQFSAGEEVSSRATGRSTGRRRTPKTYEVCDGATEGLLYFMVVFSPWAFGTTQPWSIWVMNIAAYLVGGLLVTKWVIRWQHRFFPARWESDSANDSLVLGKWSPSQVGTFLTRCLTGLTIFILLYCLVSAVNARANYLEGFSRFEYFDNFLGWLPHSYDARSTWFAFWQYLGLAFAFWAMRDWLLGKSRRERRHGVSGSGSVGASERGSKRSGSVDEWVGGEVVEGKEERADEGNVGVSEFQSTREEVSGQSTERSLKKRRARREMVCGGLPERWTRLLWVLCVNAGLVALVGMLQRLDGSNRLLWLIEPYWHKAPMSQFGPYAYRGNAAQYFNLIWPLILGLWWVNVEAARSAMGRRIGQGAHVLLLPFAVFVAAAPVVTASRGGAAVSIGTIFLAGGVLVIRNRGKSWKLQTGLLALFGIILIFAGYLGWGYLAQRLQDRGLTDLSGRTTVYRNAGKIASDYPLYGTGPGTFGAVYQLYRQDASEDWAAYTHNDWLETRVTFGWVGFSVVMLMLLIVLGHYFVGAGVSVTIPFAALIGIAMGGCLFHAIFDFPFQIHSILFVFLLECAMLFSATSATRRV